MPILLAGFNQIIIDYHYFGETPRSFVDYVSENPGLEMDNSHHNSPVTD